MTDFLDPKVEHVVRTIHLRDQNKKNDYYGRCGIWCTKDDPQLTTNPERVTCKRCKER